MHAGTSRTDFSPASGVIAISVSDPIAAGSARAAAERAGATVHRTTPRELVAGRLPDCELLLYDAVPFDEAELMLRQLRTARPGLPVLLYVPVLPGVVPALLALGQIPGVSGCAQWKDKRGAERLAELIARQCRTAPEQVVATVLDALLAGFPGRLIPFAHAVLRARARAEPCSVASVAHQLGTSPRSLYRRWPAEPMPRAKEFIDWITVLVATHTREWSGSGWGAIARAMGVDEHTLRRLRAQHRDMVGADLGFAATVLAFSRRCHIPSANAEAALEPVLQRQNVPSGGS